MTSKTNKAPRITLVTPSFNQADFLEETICSVLSQGYPNLEYIVMDGGSTDHSTNIIRRYEDRLTFWTSEKDGGQTDAIRRGFARATGEIMNWLNSDDVLAPDALWHIAKMASDNPAASIYAAATENFKDGKVDGPRMKSIPMNLTLESALFLGARPIHRHQPGIFFQRALYDEIGGLSPRYHMCMDADLHFRMIARRPVIAYSVQTVAFFRCHPRSKTQSANIQNTIRAVTEYMSICEEIGRAVNLRPNHRKAHLKTLLGAVKIGICNGQIQDIAQALKLAARLIVRGC